MSSESPETKSEPPHASSWAAPPEFYLDENLAGKTLRRSIQRYGYIVHTPPELYGSRAASAGVADEVWLRDVGKHRWAAIGRDTTILKTPSELAAYKAAKIHLFLFDGEATVTQLTAIVAATLRDICTECMNGKPSVWRARGGAHPRIELL
ncbi:PIN-like domain-containing protein [Mycolicibacterium sp. XJ2546]